MIKFSIVVPCYNLEKYIAQAIESVLAQTCRDFECIVVDDGSTDASGQIIEAFAIKDRRIRVIRKQNGGEGSARNAALDIACGEWVMFLDGDDVFRSTTLADVEGLIAQYPDVDMFGFGTQTFRAGESISWSSKTDAINVLDCSQEIIDSLGHLGITQCVYRRKVYIDDGKGISLRFGNYSIGADLVFTSVCWARAKKVVLMDKDQYGYRIRPGSAVHSRLTYRKVDDRIAYQCVMFRNLVQSKKKLGAVFWKIRGNKWIFVTAFWLYVLEKTTPCRELWEKWFDSMREARSMFCFSRTQRALAWILSVTRSRMVASLFCVWPYKFRQMIRK